MPVHLLQPPFFQNPSLRVTRRRLLAWFAKYARDLPWRHTRDPYAIWVAEVMLQQTQVAAVIPYYGKFLAAFPSIAALAGAKEQDVLRLWQGLGYYRRARDLYHAARALCTTHGGELPDDAEALGRLPGLGRYTVNAILSQAFHRPVPILETNSVRVLCRLLGVRDDPKKSVVRRRLWQASEALVPVHAPGQFNQALMELGALICTPAQPACGECPLARHCEARRTGTVQEIPRTSRSARIEEVDEVALALRKDTRMLLVQRPPAGRWANMWELPHGHLKKNETHKRGAKRLLKALGFTGNPGGRIAAVRHTVTRFRITLNCMAVERPRGRFCAGLYVRARWLTPSDMHGYPISTPQRRLIKMLGERKRLSKSG
ncbi:MAG: A/G-specific adenine glycosylase [Planctomycetes bacterium]|nr:A/G-specific adenine glycosylase [Planctomycetota bacterium]